MKTRIFIVFALLVYSGGVLAQDPAIQKYGNQISVDHLRENLTIIASDALEGRETGSRGQKMAAAFIRAHFEELGLKGPVNGNYYQPVDLYSVSTGEAYIKAGQNRFDNFNEIIYLGASDTNGEATMQVVYAGKGTKDDFAAAKVEGKGVLIVIGQEESSRAAMALARENKAKALFVVNTTSAADYQSLASQYKAYLSGGRLSLTKPEPNAQAGIYLISPVVAEKMFNTTLDKLTKAGIQKTKPATVQYKVAMKLNTVKSENVLGFMEGTDKKDEVIVITAHYDHIGKLKTGSGDVINNGADDDGSGTVAVMELARIFTKAKEEGKGPRRSILFMTVTGEEKGLLGSEYYADNPIFPLANTVVNLNIDMVGRRDPQHKDSAPYVYVIGSDKLSTELHQLSEKTNNTYTKLIFDYTYNDQNHPDRLYYRSDHWNFAKNNIPIIFYFDGIHEDYHKPSDEVDKIEFDLLAERTKLVFYTAWEIANRDQRIKPDVK